jgi:outer membrane protein assembly factor BamB
LEGKPMKRLFVPAALLLLAQSTSADNWPAWRGPDGNGHCKEKNLPVNWSDTENVRWKVALPSGGMSTPVIWGDRIFLTQATNGGQKRAVMCFDRKAGKLLWQQVVDYQEKEAELYVKEDHPYCRASPVTDGERVIVSHGSAGVFGYDLQGKELWHRELGKFVHDYGNASSPVLYGDLVILNCGPGETTFLVALDKKSGKQVWRADGPSQTDRYTCSFVTPVIATIKDRDELIMSWPRVVKAYDPRTGKPLWSCEGLGTMIQNHSPLVTADVIVAMSSYGSWRDMAIKTGGNGDVTETHRLWYQNSPPRTGAGVVVGDCIYATGSTNSPFVECMELKTGKIVWKERLGVGFWSSMVHADGRLYVTDLGGGTFVLAATPKFEVVSRNPLEERTVASPAISDGEIFIRTYKHLWCISNK